MVVIIASIGAGGWYAWQVLQSDQIPEKLEPYSKVINELKSHIKTADELPEYIASGNGRIEATEYDIATKIAGRLTKVLAEEGDMVEAGQALAVIDTDDLDAQLLEANAGHREAIEARKYAMAIVEQYKSELSFAQTELRRFLELSKQGHLSQEKVDQQRTVFKSADAALKAANIKVVQSAAGIEAAEARIQRLQSEY